MKHHAGMRKLGRERNARKALLRSLATNLIRDGRIKTTEAKAKELRPFIERLITHAKKDTISAKRLVASRLGGEAKSKKLFTDIAPKYADRNGGYTRVIKMPTRAGDESRMAFIEFV